MSKPIKIVVVVVVIVVVVFVLNIGFNFGVHYWVHKEKCVLNICCMDKCYCDSWHPLKMVQGSYL